MRKISLVESIRQAQKRLAALREETKELELELSNARAALAGESDGHSYHTLISGVPAQRARTKPIKPNSSVDWTIKALKMHGQAMDMDSIIALVKAMGGPVIKKSTLVSNLSRYAKTHDTFVRTAPNTFGLLEWEAGFEQSAEERFGVEGGTEH